MYQQIFTSCSFGGGAGWSRDFLGGAGAENFYPEPEKKSEAGEKWLGSTKSLQRVSESNLIKRKKYKVNICSFFIISVGAGMAPNKRGMAPALQHFFKYTVA